MEWNFELNSIALNGIEWDWIWIELKEGGVTILLGFGSGIFQDFFLEEEKYEKGVVWRKEEHI
jgi:hypothetical protein